jgi:hypothetical protein
VTTSKQDLINARLADFIRQLSIEEGEPALAAVVVVQWNATTTAGMIMIPLPMEERMKVVSAMSRALSTTVERLRNQASSVREDK